MRGINKVILVGTLGRDPETKTFPNGGSVTNFSIATSESWTDKTTGERREQTEWHRISLNNRLGEIAQQYLRKGSKVYIEGSLRTRQWTDQNGQERYLTEIRGDNMQMLDSRPTGDYAGGNNNAYPNNNAGFGQPRFNPQNDFQAQGNGYGGGYNNAGNFNNNAGFQNPAPASQPQQSYNTGFNTPNAPTAPTTAPSAPAAGEAGLDDDLPF